MVMEWGMSDALGRIRYRDNQEEVFLGHSVSRAQNMSTGTAQLIDNEIRRLITDGEATARKVLTEHIDELHTVAKGLLEYETLSGQEVRDLLNGQAAGARVHYERRSAQAPFGGSLDGQPRAAQGPRSWRHGASAVDLVYEKQKTPSLCLSPQGERGPRELPLRVFRASLLPLALPWKRENLAWQTRLAVFAGRRTG